MTRKEPVLGTMRGAVLDALRNKLHIHGVKKHYDELTERYKQVVGSDYYTYRVHDPGLPKEQIPLISSELLQIFYADCVKDAMKFHIAENALIETKERIVGSSEMSASEMIATGEAILDNGYDLVSGLYEVNRSPLTPIKTLGSLPDRIHVEFKQLAKEVGTQKDETFRETVRRHIPRWMTYQIPPPIDENPETSLWTHYTSADVNLLVNPADIAKGAPLHKVFQIADKEPDPEKGYDIKTNTLLNVLHMEQERYTQPENPEVPFFRYVMAGAMVGGPNKLHKGRFFNYQSAIVRTIRQTYQRLQRELPAGERGMGVRFIDQLGAYYPAQFTELLAKSIINAASDGEIDEVSLVRELANGQFDWSPDLLEKILAQPSRRVFTQSEVQEAVHIVHPEVIGEIKNPHQFEEDTDSISKDEDIYTFKMNGKQLGLAIPNMKIELVGEVDAMSESVDIVITSMQGDQVRSIPFTLHTSGALETVRLDTIEGVVQDTAVLIALRDIAAKALNAQAVEVRKQPAAQPIIPKPTVVDIEGASSVQPRLSRDERIQAYLKQKAMRQDQRLHEPVAQSTSSHGAEELQQPVQSSDKGITITNFDTPQINKYLADERIEGLDAERLRVKVQHFVEMAKVGKKMLGKRVEVESVSAELGDIINLRQLSWTLESKRAIRIYLQDIGEGKFVLRGIMSKKGSAQQKRYIERIIADIVTEMSA